MENTKRIGLPGPGSLASMLIFNTVAAFVIVTLLFRIFDVPDLLSVRSQDVSEWTLRLMMVPGLGVASTGLWFWLILHGRAKGVNWGAAFYYGASLAFLNVPLSALVLGMLVGSPFFYFIFSLALLALSPMMTIAILCTGVALGFLNGLLADRWIERRK